MKNYYLILVFLFTSIFCTAQNYELGIVHISNYDFKIVAIPDFDSAGNTDVSDVGFTLVLPAGSVDATNPVGLLTARIWSIQQFDAAFLSGLGLGDGTKDVFQFNLPPGQSILSHTNGQQIDLVSFQIINAPVTDQMYFLLNSDPIAMGASGVLDSFYNSNIDATTTEDYFSAPTSGLDSFMFSTLSTEEFNETITNVSIYPNPVSNYLYVKSDVENDYSIYSINGREVLKSTLEIGTNTLDLSSLESGVYFLNVKVESGEINKKLIKL